MLHAHIRMQYGAPERGIEDRTEERRRILTPLDFTTLGDPIAPTMSFVQPSGLHSGAEQSELDSAPVSVSPRSLAVGLFLIALGAPILIAFAFQLVPSGGRRGASVWDATTYSPKLLPVLLIGSAVGLALVIAGMVSLKLSARRGVSQD